MNDAQAHDPWHDLKQAVMAPCRPEELVPPPRFASKSFETFVIDGGIAGQREAVAAVRAFATRRAGWFSRLFRGSERAGLYLDGGFGVGKTHLLAASFVAAHGTKRYLSFPEAISLVVLHGAQRTADLLKADMVCIDEFELDDPANTRLADLLLQELVERGCRIITTSNTVPGELGQGRLFVDQFRSQLSRIADVFSDIHVPGRDYRRRHQQDGDENPPQWNANPPSTAPSLDAKRLDRLLMDVPIVNLRHFARRFRALVITGLTPFTDQLAALRFVHLVDKLYDNRVDLTVQADFKLSGLFPEEHCQKAFAKKYQRCLSRLVECCTPNASERLAAL